MKNIKYTAPIGMFIKKHYCPKCSNILTTHKIKKIVNSESEEAKDFDFTSDAIDAMGHLVGDVEFIRYVYRCGNCDIEIINSDMIKHEREKIGKKERSWHKTLGLILFILSAVVFILFFIFFKSDKISVKNYYSVNPFYVYLQKHYCPQCNLVLKVKYDSKIVNSNSSEAKDYNFIIGDSTARGDVEFRTNFFFCQNCELGIPFDEMKKYEKEKE